MNKANRWGLMNKVFIISLFLIVAFAYFDVQNVIGINQVASASTNPKSVWDVFWDVQSPAFFNMRLMILGGVALIWYIFKKDKSEALALFLTPAIMIFFGVQDLFYYFISSETIAESIGCWADVITPVGWISDNLGEVCPTATSFIISSVIGIGIAYFVYRYLQKAKW